MDSDIMTTTEYLIELIAAKRDMRAALLEKGVQTWGGLNIYPEAINRISTRVARIILTNGMKLCNSEWETIEVDCSNVTSLEELFLGCVSLKNVGIGDTSHITDFSEMFSGCYQLVVAPELDISSLSHNWRMFYECYRLEEVRFKGNPSGWLSNGSFAGCEANGTLYYDSRYDYSDVIEDLPSNWRAIPYNVE